MKVEQKIIKQTIGFILKELEQNGKVSIILDLFVEEDVQRILDSVRVVGYNIRNCKGVYRIS